MSFTNTAEAALLDKEFSATDYTPPATLYAALFTTAPADDGTGGTEANYTNYVRVGVTNNGTQFPSANPKVNANAISFPQAGAAQSGQIKALGWYSASTSGTLRSWAYLCDNLVPAFVGLNTGDLIWAPGHAFSNDTRVIVWAPAGQTLPTGLSAGTEYYVINASGNSFQLSTSSGGAAVAITVDGSGIIARSRFTTINEGDTPQVAASGFSMTMD